VGRYMVRHRRPPSRGWKTFLRSHVGDIASVDPFVVRTISFKLLYGLVILRHACRRLVTIAVTANPTAQWIAGQVTEAFPWDEAPTHLLRDRDQAFGAAYTHRIRNMGSAIAPHAPWQNGHIERLIGSIRREALDHLVVRRSPLAARAEELCFVLQPGPYSSFIEQRRADCSALAKAWLHRSDPSPRWTPSSIRPGLGFD
jgi:hypothetical protein